LSVHLIYLLITAVVSGNEIFLCMLAVGGPILFLIQVIP
jgi:hypothetical protein